MKNALIQLCLCASVPCGFADNTGEISANAAMTELLALNSDTPEMVALLDEIRNKKSPFYVLSHLSSGFNSSTKIWQFDFIPFFDNQNGYIGTFFHAHEFLFLSPLEYVDGIQPYVVTMEKPNKLFTDKEWQVLFFTMQRLSSKEIARRLNLSRITVDNKLQIIYQKAGVHSAYELREFYKAKGFDLYIPKNLFPRSPIQVFESVGGVV